VAFDFPGVQRTSKEKRSPAKCKTVTRELAWIASHARVDFNGTIDAFVEKATAGIAIRPITIQIAFLANQLPATYPSDSSDRLIGATAIAEGIELVTKDRAIRQFSQIKTIW
jgi:PIN domain nuclease of toxin-antitoxin system